MAEIKKIKKDFEFLKKEKGLLGVLLFGSRAEKKPHKKSDFDICIVAPNQEPSVVLGKVFRKLDTVGKKYDVHVFEELPLYLQMEIIKNHRIMFTKDKYELYEYFYFYRKLWKDQAHRNTPSKKEIMKTL